MCDVIQVESSYIRCAGINLEVSGLFTGLLPEVRDHLISKQEKQTT